MYKSRFSSDSTFGSMPLLFKIVPILFVLAFVASGYSYYINDSNVMVVDNCKVLDLQQQSIISSPDKNVSTEIRYLVITDKETFICKSSLLNSKFNNSDVFWRLKKDSTYNFRVAGVGKSLIFDYRNVLEVVK